MERLIPFLLKSRGKPGAAPSPGARQMRRGLALRRGHRRDDHVLLPGPGPGIEYPCSILGGSSRMHSPLLDSITVLPLMRERCP